MKRRAALWVLILLTLCGFGNATAQEAVTLTVEKQALIVAVGRTAQVKAAAAPYAARKAGISYQSSDEGIATVDSRGRIKGVSVGECQITVKSNYDESVAATVRVSVVKPVKRLAAQVESASIHIGQSTRITCAYTPEDATLQSAVYASSREKVATVDENGVVTGHARGQAVITVKSADGAASARVTVKVLQPPTSVSLSPETLTLTTGKKAAIKAVVLPKNADNKKLTWFSSDESVATVDSRGRVTSVAPGQAVITAACEDDPSVTASVTLRNMRLASSVSFPEKSYDVTVGHTFQLEPQVLPEDTTNKAVTYKVKNPKIASVDENGLVTALKGGKTTVTVVSTDGSKRRATVTIRVVVPVTGVSFKQPGIRVGAGNYTYVTAVLEPENATIQNMTWSSSDESVATVKGSANKARVSGRRWGRCQLTGVTEDGGYRASIDVNVGSLRRAVKVESIELRDGKPYIVLKNHSDMYITSVSYIITGTDEQNNTIRLSTRSDTLFGTYSYTLAPGEETQHDRFSFQHEAKYTNLQSVSIAITGWETDTGYYDNYGNLQYTYEISDSHLEWTNWQTDYYKQIQSNPRAN